MNRKAIIQNVFEGKENRRLPRALFGAGLWAYKQAGLKIEEIIRDPDRFAQTLSSVYENLDTDIIFAGSGLNSFPAEAIGGTLRFRGEQAPMLASPILWDKEGIRRIGEIDCTASTYTRALVQMIGRLRKNFPDRFLCVTSPGPFTWSMILCDWDLLKKKVVTNKEFIREVTELGVRLSAALFDHLIDLDLIDGISIADGAVTLIPDSDYKELVLSLERELFNRVKKRGVRCILHQCGKTASQLALYPETGAECISVDTHVAIRDAYELYRGRLITAGNVDVLGVIEKGNALHIRRAVADCIGQIENPGNRYILMPSCDLPLATPLQNVKEFLSCADRQYPEGINGKSVCL